MNEDVSRRSLLQQVGVGALGLAAGSLGGRAWGAESAEGFTRLGEHLLVYHGPINVGVVRDGSKAWLIDCGDGSVTGALAGIGVSSVDQVVFTHHHRDQACGAHLLADRGARIGVPAEERGYFDDVAAYWNDPQHRWHLYNLHPHHLMLGEPVRVDVALRDGDVLTWGPARIRVLATPGHTDGSVSYVVEVDGQRVIFSGDVIYDEGQLWDLHSLQKGCHLENGEITDYHGFLGTRVQLVESLKRIKAAKPDVLVPAHGRIMTDPAKAIDTLVQRLEVCYDQYVAIASLRHYFPALFSEYAGRAEHMAIRKGKPAPSCLRHFGTTWMIVSESKAAFVMDCGSGEVVRTIKELVRRGEIGTVEGLWVTHYHDDHVEGIPEFQKTFDCPCITDRAVAQVITDPLAWRLPCISPSKARVDRATSGESWTWHEFKMTAYHFPGQTLYHAGLLVEGQGVRMFFAGDSFSMGGIDDYCTSNRNWLGGGKGFDRCIALIEELKPTHMFNCHIPEAFDFTPEQCRFMRANLAKREDLFGQLVPWDHANYGMDEPWVRCYPYEQRVKAGDRLELRVVVTNHSAQLRVAACRAVLPRAWGGAGAEQSRTAPADGADRAEWTEAELPAKTEGEILLPIQVPADVGPGRYVICVDLKYATWTLPQFTEAVVEIQDG